MPAEPNKHEWRWFVGAQRYYDFTAHRYVAAKTVRDWGWQAISAGRDTAKDLAQQLDDKKLNVGDWQALMRQGLKDSYIQQYLLGRGGLNMMAAENWGSVGGMLADQYRYLDKFAAQIANDELSLGQIQARAQMYFNSAQEAYWRAFETTTGMPPLPAHPGDGTTKCLTNCRCGWSVKPVYQGNRKGRKLIGWDARWTLAVAEHCHSDEVDKAGRPRGCLERAALWNPLELRLPPADQAATADAAKGGPGSGNFRHRGRPGKVGGSAPDDWNSLDRRARAKWPGSDFYIGRFSDESKRTILRTLARVHKQIPLGDFTVTHSNDEPWTRWQLAYTDTSGDLHFNPNMWGDGKDAARRGLIDLLKERGQLPADAGDEYVVAHEIGHHLLDHWSLGFKLDQLKAVRRPGERTVDKEDFAHAFASVITGGQALDPEYARQVAKALGLRRSAAKGGPGSGFFNHAGRPGKVGGSSAGHGAPAAAPKHYEIPEDAWYVDESEPERTRAATEKLFAHWESLGWDIDTLVHDLGSYPQYANRDYSPDWGITAGTYTAYRGSNTHSATATNPGGFFFSPTRPEAESYSHLHPNGTTAEYRVTLRNPLVVRNQGALTKQWWNRSWQDTEARLAKKHHGDVPAATWDLDCQIAKHARQDGYDSIVYTHPRGPATREICILNRASAEVVAGTEKAISLKGGPGSGNFGHAGRPGRVGGSASIDVPTPIRVSRANDPSLNWDPHQMSEAEFHRRWRQSAQTEMGVPIVDLPADRADHWVGYHGEREMTVYRGSAAGGAIEPGEFVSPSAEYARSYGAVVQALTVPAAHLRYVRGSIHGDPADYGDNTPPELVYAPMRLSFHRRYHSYDWHKLSGQKGGPGSGNYGHAGRPGKVGGSAARPASHPGGFRFMSPKGPIEVLYDPQNVAESDARQVEQWAANIPPEIWQESHLRSVRVFEDPSDADAWVREHYPDEFVSESRTIIGIYDQDTGQAVISRFDSGDMTDQGDGYSGRNFYHEFAHSTGLSTHDDWFYQANEWPADVNTERFSDAFADWMVAKHYYERLPGKGAWAWSDSKETYLQEFERMRPGTAALFERWGL